MKRLNSVRSACFLLQNRKEERVYREKCQCVYRKESTYSASRISMRSSLPVSGTRTRGLRSARNTSQTRVSVSDTVTSSSVGRGGLRCRGHEGSPADLTISCAQGIVGMYSSYAQESDARPVSLVHWGRRQVRESVKKQRYTFACSPSRPNLRA